MILDIKHFPTLPGVYLMKDNKGQILYIGKAKNLKNRVKQYFIPGRDGRTIVPFLTAQVDHIDTIVVTTDKEALLLENNLIKKHQPKYNALLKDDKTFFSLAINHKHMWPMIRVVRYKGKPPSNHLYFGPYAHGYAARQTLNLLRTLFPLRQCSDRELINRSRPCILYELKRCVAPCVAKCTKPEYDQYVDQVIDFLKGHDDVILKQLKTEMEQAVRNLEFEKADRLYQTIQAIEQTLEEQRVDTAGREDLDVIGLYREADSVVLSQLLFREGKLLTANVSLFLHNAQEDVELLSSFIMQHYVGKKLLPKQIILPIPIPENKDLESLIKVKILVPQKGNKKALLRMAQSNAEVKFQREKELLDRKEQLLMELEETLKLINYPEKIECFDNSNIGGTEPVSAMVVYTQGEKDKKRYRKYKLKATDDYGAMKEVLTRRYLHAKEEDNLPDLILIDGGKGHLNLALNVLSEMDISTVDVIAIAKEDSKHTRGITREQIFLPGEKLPLMLSTNSPILFMLQQIRDEAHRFAITFQRQRRSKKTFASALDSLAGIGPIKKQRLLRHFKSLKRVLEASPEELAEVKGINKKDIEVLDLIRRKINEF